MKIASVFFASLATLIAIVSCNNSQSRYLDLNTNKYIGLKKDSVSGYLMNARTGEPVDIYVDTKTHDTISGTTGEVVNGKIYKNEDGRWIVRTSGNEYGARSESDHSAKVKVKDDKYKLKDGNYMVKEKSDGDEKIKTGNREIKINEKTGQRKVKKNKKDYL